MEKLEGLKVEEYFALNDHRPQAKLLLVCINVFVSLTLIYLINLGRCPCMVYPWTSLCRCCSLRH